MPKLRHLALHAADLEGTAGFYKKIFDMVEVGRNDSAVSEAIYLSDGTLNLSILRFRTPELAEKMAGSSAFGLSHLGFLVEDVKETARRLREAGAVHIDVDTSRLGLLFSEDKWKGPDGTVFDITDQVWTGAEPLK